MTDNERPEVEIAPIVRWLRGEIPSLKAEYLLNGVDDRLLRRVHFTSAVCLYPDRRYVLFGGSQNTAHLYRDEVLSLGLGPKFARYDEARAEQGWRRAVEQVQAHGLPIGFYAKGVYTQPTGRRQATAHRRTHVTLLWAVKGVPLGYFLRELQSAVKRAST